MIPTFRQRLRPFLPLIVLLICIPLVLALCSTKLLGSASQEDLNMVRESVRRAAVECYALEGSYPSDLSYLQEHYGLAVDLDRYFVDYQYIASNLVPDITVFPRTGPSQN